MRHVRIFNLFVSNFLPVQLPVRKTLSTCIHCGRFQMTPRIITPMISFHHTTAHRPAEPSIAITKLSSQGRPSEALSIYLKLLQDGKFPSQESLYQLTRAMYRASDMVGMFTIHDTLLSYYSKQPKISNRSSRSLKYMYTMLINLIASSTKPVDMAVICSLCKEMTLFTSINNIVLYNVLIKTLLQQKRVEQAHALYDDLISNQIQPSIMTFAIFLKDASTRKDMPRFMKYLDELEKYDNVYIDYSIVSIVVTTLCDLQAFDKAVDLVEKLQLEVKRDEMITPKYRNLLLNVIESRRKLSDQKKKRKRKKHAFVQ